MFATDKSPAINHSATIASRCQSNQFVNAVRIQPLILALTLVLCMLISPAQAAILVWDEAIDGDVGDGTTWTDPLNWRDPATTTDQVPTASDTLYIGAGATLNGSPTPGLTNLSPVFNLTGNQTVSSLNIASVTFDDRNSSLATQTVSVAFNNGGNSNTLTTSSLGMAFSNRSSGTNFALLTLGNTAVDPNQTLHVTNSATIGSLRNADANLIVKEGGTLLLGTSPVARMSTLDLGYQRSGTVSISDGLIQAQGGTVTAYVNLLRMGRNESTTTSNPNNLGRGTIDLRGIVLGQGGNILDVNGAYLAHETLNGDAQQATINLGEGTARFGWMRLGRDNSAAGAALTEAEINLEGTIVQVDNAAGIIINGTSSINVTVQGDNAGLDLALGVPLTINDSGELNITFENSSLEVGEIYWGMRAVGDRVSEFESLSGLNIFNNSNQTPSIFFQNGFTYVGFVVVPEPGSLTLFSMGALLLISTRRRRSSRSKEQGIQHSA